MSQVVKNSRCFLQFLAVCPPHQRQFLLRTASPQQLHALVQVLYNILKEYIRTPEENKRNVLPYKDVNGSGDEDTQESDNDSENDSEETESSSPEPSTVIHSENLCEHCENSNVYGTLIMKCPKCVGTITTKIVLYAITRSPRREITSKRAFFGVTIVEQLFPF